MWFIIDLYCRCVEAGIRTSLALQANINTTSFFDRKVFIIFFKYLFMMDHKLSPFLFLPTVLFSGGRETKNNDNTNFGMQGWNVTVCDWPCIFISGGYLKLISFVLELKDVFILSFFKLWIFKYNFWADLQSLGNLCIRTDNNFQMIKHFSIILYQINYPK